MNMCNIYFSHASVYGYNFRWYFGKIKRIEAEKKLLQPENEHGAFLIRDSESRRNYFSLSGKIYLLKCYNYGYACVYFHEMDTLAD